MQKKKRFLKCLVLCIAFFTVMVLIGPTLVQVVPLVGGFFKQPKDLPKTLTWAPLPPYNLLWPLWSPVLSPPDPVTKLPTPLVSKLDKNTVLPIQPVLVWDNVAFPNGPAWLTYNIPAELGGGLLYWTSLYGLNPFPPSYLLTPGGFPVPNPLLSNRP